MIYVKENSSVTQLSPSLSKIQNDIQSLKDQYSGLNIRVDAISKTIYLGDYGKEWKLSDVYQKTGNSRPSYEDNYYKITQGNSNIFVKQRGYYLVDFTGSYLNKGNGGNVWVQLLRGGTPIRTHIQYIYGYGGSIAFTSYWWLEPGWEICAQISTSSDELYSTGQEQLEVIKLN